MIKKDLIHIGSRELVSFPEASIVDVPAKIDTGADTTSVWASAIEEHEGELSFVLFAPGSRYYSGKKITTKKYKFTVVRNSFGETQPRYKVKMLLFVRGKKINAEVTLADRGNNRYPILVGKKTLQDRFVVDVTRDGIIENDRPVKVLVMNSKESASIRSFFEEMGHETKNKVVCDFKTYEDIGLEILKGTTRATVLSTNKDITSYDLIYFKTYFKNAEIAAAMAEIAAAHGIRFIDEEVLTYHAKTKLTQYVKLARYNVPVPDSIVLPATHLKGKYDMLKRKLGNVFVMKDVATDKGESNYLVRSEEDFEKVVKRSLEDNTIYVSQHFVENDGDYRVVVLHKSIELIIKRTLPDASTHLTNTSQGGKAELVPVASFASDASAIAVQAAVIMNRQIAGVDLVYDKKRKQWLVFEVNNSPQITSGSFIDEKKAIMWRFLAEYAKK